MNNDDKKRIEAEQEAISRALDANKRKRILIKAAVWIGAALVLLFVMWLILRNCSGNKDEKQSYSYDPFSLDNGKTFYPQSLDYDVFTDEEYADKDKGVWFKDKNGMEEYFLPEERNSASPQIRLFIDYFDAAIHGDGKTLNKLFTDEYFENDGNALKKYPDRFLMQKIYSVKVETWGTAEIEDTDEGPIVYEHYKVGFLIKDNNGEFRPDLADDEKSSIPVIYDVITFKGESKINHIWQINYDK